MTDKNTHNTSRPCLLVVDDQEIMHLLLSRIFAPEWEVLCAFNLKEALDLAYARSVDLAIIDIHLEKETGLEVIDEFKRAFSVDGPTYYIVLSNDHSGTVQARAHLLGATEYLKKPIDVEVLKAISKKYLNFLRPASFSYGPFQIDVAMNRFCVNGVETKLTVNEFLIMLCMLKSPKIVHSREKLHANLQKIGHEKSDSLSRTVDMHVSSIRKKIGDQAVMIITERGIGYRLKNQ